MTLAFLTTVLAACAAAAMIPAAARAFTAAARVCDQAQTDTTTDPKGNDR